MKNVILVIDLILSIPFMVIGFLARFVYACLVGGWRIGTMYSNWVEAK